MICVHSTYENDRDETRIYLSSTGGPKTPLQDPNNQLAHTEHTERNLMKSDNKSATGEQRWKATQ